MGKTFGCFLAANRTLKKVNFFSSSVFIKTIVLKSSLHFAREPGKRKLDSFFKVLPTEFENVIVLFLF